MVTEKNYPIYSRNIFNYEGTGSGTEWENRGDCVTTLNGSEHPETLEYPYMQYHKEESCSNYAY